MTSFFFFGDRIIATQTLALEKLKSIIEPTLRLIPLVLPTKAVPPVAVDSADVEMNGTHDETNDDKAAPTTSTTNPPAAPQPIEEDDIFPSVGEYMPDLKRKESADKVQHFFSSLPPFVNVLSNRM